MPIRPWRMSIERQMTDSRPSDHTQYQGNDCNNEQNMDHATRAIYKKA